MKTLKWNGLNIHVGDWIWIEDKICGSGGITKIINIKKSLSFNKKNEDNGNYVLILNDSKINDGDWYLYKNDMKKEIFIITKIKKELLSRVIAKIL